MKFLLRGLTNSVMKFFRGLADTVIEVFSEVAVGEQLIIAL